MSRPLITPPACSIPPPPLTRRLLLLSTVALGCTTALITPPPAQANPFSSAATGGGGGTVLPPALPFSSTPYSQSQTLQLGLDNNGKIRACPATNPGCVSTNPRVGASSSLASPLLIPEEVTSGKAAVNSLRQAIIRTQKNVSFKVDRDTPYGHYIQAEVDGGWLGRDVMEFLVKKREEEASVVAYRCVATKVTFVYPFTTAVGDSRGQKQRIAAVSQELGWYAPDITQSSIDADDRDAAF